MPAISFEKTRVNTLGHYVIGRNSFGIRENININRVHLYRPMWDILATLLHELAHSWQYMYGKPSKSWFHNKEFCQKLASFGIFCSNKGCHDGVGEPFTFILKKHAVSLDNLVSSEMDGIMIPPKKGKTKRELQIEKMDLRMPEREGRQSCF